MKWLSRKLIVTVITVLLTSLLSRFGVPEDVQLAVIGMVTAWILGQSAVDAAAAARGTAASAAIAKSESVAEVKAVEKTA